MELEDMGEIRGKIMDMVSKTGLITVDRVVKELKVSREDAKTALEELRKMGSLVDVEGGYVRRSCR